MDREVMIKVPMDAPHLDRYATQHLDVSITRELGLVVRSMYEALDARGARMNNGRRIVNQVDVIRWLLEEIGIQAGMIKTKEMSRHGEENDDTAGIPAGSGKARRARGQAS